MTDETFELMQKISKRVHALVDKATEKLSGEEDKELRQTLTEQFRFWRRLEEERLSKVLAEYIRQRKNFFKELTKPALREWKGADVKLAEEWNRYQAGIHKTKEKK